MKQSRCHVLSPRDASPSGGRPRQPARVVIPDNLMGWHTRPLKAHPLKVIRSGVIEKPGSAERHVYEIGRAQPHEEVAANIGIRMRKSEDPVLQPESRSDRVDAVGRLPELLCQREISVQ